MSKKVPVLFLVFNRLKTAEHSLQSIRAYQPERLYISADGPRLDVEGEAEKCAAVRASILSQIDWPCEVKTRFLDENIGCGLGPSTAISWMFEFEEYGIILEDDCWVSIDFYKLCEELLPKYANHESVAQINSGNSYAPCYGESNTYRFSYYPEIWGWATWRRSWEHFDIHMKDWPKLRKKMLLTFPFLEACIRYCLWNKVYKTIQQNKKLKIWDIQWSLYVFVNKKLCVQPGVDLSYNFSLAEGDTNNESGFYNRTDRSYGKLLLPFHHPKNIMNDSQKDNYLSKRIVRHYLSLAILKIKKIIKK